MTYDPRAKALLDMMYTQRFGKTVRVVADDAARDLLDTTVDVVVITQQDDAVNIYDADSGAWKKSSGSLKKVSTFADLATIQNPEDGDPVIVLNTNQLVVYDLPTGQWVVVGGGSGPEGSVVVGSWKKVWSHTVTEAPIDELIEGLSPGRYKLNINMDGPLVGNSKLLVNGVEQAGFYAKGSQFAGDVGRIGVGSSMWFSPYGTANKMRCDWYLTADHSTVDLFGTWGSPATGYGFIADQGCTAVLESLRFNCTVNCTGTIDIYRWVDDAGLFKSEVYKVDTFDGLAALDAVTKGDFAVVANPLSLCFYDGVAWKPMNGSVTTTSNGQTPVGSFMWFVSENPPLGWSVADGGALSKVEYPLAYSVIGDTFGSTETTFNKPDLRGEFIRGFDGGKGTDAGRVFGSAQGDAIRNITGIARMNAVSSAVDQEDAGALSAERYGTTRYRYVGSGTYYGANVLLDASKVVPTADDNRPKNIALLPCIKIEETGPYGFTKVGTETDLATIENPALADMAMVSNPISMYMYNGASWLLYSGGGGGGLLKVADIAALSAIESPADGDTVVILDTLDIMVYDAASTQWIKALSPVTTDSPEGTLSGWVLQDEVVISAGTKITCPIPAGGKRFRIELSSTAATTSQHLLGAGGKQLWLSRHSTRSNTHDYTAYAAVTSAALTDFTEKMVTLEGELFATAYLLLNMNEVVYNRGSNYGGLQSQALVDMTAGVLDFSYSTPADAKAKIYVWSDNLLASRIEGATLADSQAFGNWVLKESHELNGEAVVIPMPSTDARYKVVTQGTISIYGNSQECTNAGCHQFGTGGHSSSDWTAGYVTGHPFCGSGGGFGEGALMVAGNSLVSESTESRPGTASSQHWMFTAYTALSAPLEHILIAGWNKGATTGSIKIYEWQEIVPVELHSYETVYERHLDNELLEDVEIPWDGELHPDCKVETHLHTMYNGAIHVTLGINDFGVGSHAQRWWSPAGLSAWDRTRAGLVVGYAYNGQCVMQSDMYMSKDWGNSNGRIIQKGFLSNTISTAPQSPQTTEGWLDIPPTEAVSKLTLSATQQPLTGTIRITRPVKTHLLTSKPGLLTGMWQKSDGMIVTVAPGEAEINGAICLNRAPAEISLLTHLKSGENLIADTYYYLYAVQNGMGVGFEFSIMPPTMDRYGNVIPDVSDRDPNVSWHPVGFPTRRWIGQVLATDSVGGMLGFTKASTKYWEGLYIASTNTTQTLPHGAGPKPTEAGYKVHYTARLGSDVQPVPEFATISDSMYGAFTYGVLDTALNMGRAVNSKLVWFNGAWVTYCDVKVVLKRG